MIRAGVLANDENGVGVIEIFELHAPECPLSLPAQKFVQMLHDEIDRIPVPIKGLR